MRRVLYFILPVLIILGLAGFAKRDELILDAVGLKAKRGSLEEREALLAPAMQFFIPEGREGPFPAVIQFHGCAGIRQPFMEQWAKVANEAGYMAVVVDSFGPRGITRDVALKTVCVGTMLLGQERAGDVLAAYDIVRKRNDVDASKIVLAGWSHGGWSVLDFIALDPPRRWPAGLAHEALQPVEPAGFIGVYPYCGLGNWSKAVGWRKPLKGLMLIAGVDTIVDPKECPALAEKLNAKGAEIEVDIYPDADHVFDDPYLEDEYKDLYNARDHAEAAARYKAFLEEIKG
ncbi:MAG: dienelactone hydrolase family protein [Parvularculaceae bacterium]